MDIYCLVKEIIVLITLRKESKKHECNHRRLQKLSKQDVCHFTYL